MFLLLLVTLDLLLPLLLPTVFAFAGLLDLSLTLLFPTLLLLARTLNLFRAPILLLPTLLSFAGLLDLPLSLLFPALLTFGAVLLLLLASLFVPLLLLDLLFVPAIFLCGPASFAFLLPLLARRLVFLSPLFSAAASALTVREITCSDQRGGDSKRQPDLF